MTKTVPSKIVLKSPQGRYDEARAGGAITPGHLLNLASDSDVVVHASAAGQGPVMVAIENSLIEGTIATAYAEGDLVRYWLPLPGDELYMILEDGHDVDVGAILESAGDGTLQPVSGNFGRFQAIEAVDTSGGAAATARIRVRVLA